MLTARRMSLFECTGRIRSLFLSPRYAYSSKCRFAGHRMAQMELPVDERGRLKGTALGSDETHMRKTLRCGRGSKVALHGALRDAMKRHLTTSSTAP